MAFFKNLKLEHLLYFSLLVSSCFAYAQKSLKEKEKMKKTVELKTSKQVIDYFKIHGIGNITQQWDTKLVVEYKSILKNSNLHTAKKTLFEDYTNYSFGQSNKNGWTKVFHSEIEEDESIRGWQITIDALLIGGVSVFILNSGDILSVWLTPEG